MRAMRWQQDSGQTLAEMALTLPMFFLLTMGAIDLGRYVHTRSTAMADAEAAARQLSVISNQSSDCSALAAAIKNGGGMNLVVDPHAYAGGGAATAASGVPMNSGYVYIAPAVGPDGTHCSGTSRAGGTVQVQITYRMSMITPLLSTIIPSVTLSVTAQDRTEY